MIKQAIIVEGRYDKNTLSQIIDAPIFETGGFQIFKDSKRLAMLRRVAEERGVIIFTDSDGAGFVIRNFLKGALPKDKVLHAYTGIFKLFCNIYHKAQVMFHQKIAIFFFIRSPFHFLNTPLFFFQRKRRRQFIGAVDIKNTVILFVFFKKSAKGRKKPQ